MESYLEQFVDSEVNKYFVGIVSEIYLDYNLRTKYFACALPDGEHAYIEYPIGSKVTNFFWSRHPHDFTDSYPNVYPNFPSQKITAHSKEYLDNIKEVSFIRKLLNFWNDKKQEYRRKASDQGKYSIKKLVDSYFQKSSIEECELGFVKILGSDFNINLMNLSESDYWIKLNVGRIEYDITDLEKEYDYDGPGRYYDIYGDAVGKLYEFKLRFTLKN